jgi:hypothetical protein
MSTDNLNPEEVNQPDESDQPNAENTGAAATRSTRKKYWLHRPEKQ